MPALFLESLLGDEHNAKNRLDARGGKLAIPALGGNRRSWVAGIGWMRMACANIVRDYVIEHLADDESGPS